MTKILSTASIPLFGFAFCRQHGHVDVLPVLRFSRSVFPFHACLLCHDPVKGSKLRLGFPEGKSCGLRSSLTRRALRIVRDWTNVPKCPRVSSLLPENHEFPHKFSDSLPFRFVERSFFFLVNMSSPACPGGISYAKDVFFVKKDARCPTARLSFRSFFVVRRTRLSRVRSGFPFRRDTP